MNDIIFVNYCFINSFKKNDISPSFCNNIHNKFSSIVSQCINIAVYTFKDYDCYYAANLTIGDSVLTELIGFEGHGTSIKTEQYKPSKQSKLLGKTYVNNVQVKAFTDTIKIPNFPDTQFLFYGYDSAFSLYKHEMYNAILDLYYSDKKPKESLLYHLKKNNVIDSLSFSFVANSTNKRAGQICFGPPYQYLHEDLMYKESCKRSSNYHMYCSLNSIVFNNEETIFNNTMVKFVDTQFYLSFPENYFKQIKEKYFDYCHIKRKEVNEPGYIECTCYYIEKFPEMIITIDEYTYPINLKTITIKENKRCKLMIDYNRNNPYDREEYFSIGMGFLQVFNATFFIFDTNSITFYSDTVHIKKGTNYIENKIIN